MCERDGGFGRGGGLGGEGGGEGSVSTTTLEGQSLSFFVETRGLSWTDTEISSLLCQVDHPRRATEVRFGTVGDTAAFKGRAADREDLGLSFTSYVDRPFTHLLSRFLELTS